MRGVAPFSPGDEVRRKTQGNPRDRSPAPVPATKSAAKPRGVRGVTTPRLQSAPAACTAGRRRFQNQSRRTGGGIRTFTRSRSEIPEDFRLRPRNPTPGDSERGIAIPLSSAKRTHAHHISAFPSNIIASFRNAIAFIRPSLMLIRLSSCSMETTPSYPTRRSADRMSRQVCMSWP